MALSVSSVAQMRQFLSVRYGGGWKDRLDSMSDKQVYSIYQRVLNSERRKRSTSNTKENN